MLKIYAEEKHFYEKQKNYEGDVGIDLHFPNDFSIKVDECLIINMKIKCSYNTGYYLFPRSSISSTPLILANSVGIIDPEYRGWIKVAIRRIPDTRFTMDNYEVKKGMRLFQLCNPQLTKFDYKLVDSIDNTKRSVNGFGSSGK